MSLSARINLTYRSRASLSRRLPKTARRLLLGFAITLFIVDASYATPWISAGDERTRHHLVSLVDSGAIDTPISTWPVMWASVKTALDQVDPKMLSAADLWSYQYLKHELRRQMQGWAFAKQFYVSNEDVPLTNFGSDAREEMEASISIDYNGYRTAARLNINHVHDPYDNKSLRFDGSYLSYLLGNWAIGVGSLDRWWGPGWHSSMILSNNARPTPGIFIQRNKADPIDLPVLKHLGPIQLVTFMSQMESSREDYSRPRLWGMRVNLRPHPSLEIGLSRTAMWGGEGRPGDLNTFLDLLMGRDNRGDDGATAENEPGNQLAGYDIRWHQSLNGWGVATYAQLIGEDEANGAPSRHIGMAGLEVNTHRSGAHWRATLEAHNSQVYFYDSDKNMSNTAYEHPAIYSDGYRYHGRVMGAATDNDTESVFLGLQAYLENGHAADLSVARHRFNFDDRGSDKNAFGDRALDTMEYKLSYSLPLTDHYAVKLGAFYFSNDITFQENELNVAGYLQLNGRW